MSLKLLESAIRNGVKLFGRHREEWSLSHLAEHLAPVISADAGNGRYLKFHGYGTYVPWRAKRLLTKEPETITWIDAMKNGDVFWDIGANIGVYSLYAALRPGVRVIAFEPVASTHHVLNHGIALNGMQDRVSAFCVGVGDTTGLSRLFLDKPGAGSSGHALDEAANAAGTFQSVGSQAVLRYAIDDLLERFDLPFPTHIKIDVDGIEEKIIAGAELTLRDARLKSILVEVQATQNTLDARMADAGLTPREEGRLNKIYSRVRG